MATIGNHCLLELYECDRARLNDADFVEAAITQACKRANVVLVHLKVHQFQPQGVTALALLAESHLSIHTWPERSYLAADVFTCGDAATPEAACALLIDAFKAKAHQMRMIARGPLKDA